MSNPIEASIEYLIESGWEREQAVNLCRAIKADSPEKLWGLAPQWIEHCGESMRYVRDMLGVVAHGLVDVTRAEDGEWLFQLNERGIEAGTAIAKAEGGQDE